METNTMKSKLSFMAMGIVLASAALGLAAVGHLPFFPSSARIAPVRVAEPSGARPNHTNCFIGMKGEPSEPGSLYRGWICERERLPTLAK
jgi:hypothetical protein